MSFCEFLPLKIQKNLDNILRDKLPKKKKKAKCSKKLQVS